VAHAGQIIYNPVTGENITFLKTAADTNGECLVFDCRVEPGKPGLPAHVHATQSEHFTILSGTLGVMVGGKKMTLEPGEAVLLPAKVKHQWWNAGDNDVVFRVEVTPARNLEAVLEANAGMAYTGRLNGKAMPRNPFHLANLGRLSETYLPVIPIPLQKGMLGMSSAIGRVFGVDPEFRTLRAQALERAAVTATAQVA